MKIMFKTWLFPLLLITACSTSETFYIKDATVQQTFEFNHTDPSTLTIKCKGSINKGDGTIEIKGEDPTHRLIIKMNQSQLDTLIHTDWYSTKNQIIYTPNMVDKGEITLRINLG